MWSPVTWTSVISLKSYSEPPSPEIVQNKRFKPLFKVFWNSFQNLIFASIASGRPQRILEAWLLNYKPWFRKLNDWPRKCGTQSRGRVIHRASSKPGSRNTNPDFESLITDPENVEPSHLDESSTLLSRSLAPGSRNLVLKVQWLAQ